MPNQNIFQQRIAPVKPRTLSEQRVFVYVPKAGTTTPGIAYYDNSQFSVSADGKVTLKWPMSLQIENNSVNDPLRTIARTKFLPDEFVHTNTKVTLTHPVTGTPYSNTNAELKFKRTGQNLFNKPGFIMVNDNDFETEEVESNDLQDPGRYVTYKLKKNNPLEQASLVKLNRQDFAYKNNEATIRWPYAHDTALGTINTNGYGLVKIKPNSEGILKYDNGYLVVDNEIILNETDAAPVYGGLNNGFDDYNDYVQNGLATRDEHGHMKLKLTKDAIGLSKVANKAFGEYQYNDFGPELKQYFTDEFNKKLDKTIWNTLFSDWSEPVGTTVQEVITDLRDEDESLRDAIRSSRAYLGFFEDLPALENRYPADQWTYGSTAYLNDTKTFWRVRVSNVDAIIEGRNPTRDDVPTEALDKTTFRIGRTDTKQVFQWDGSKFVLTTIILDWVDAVVMNEEDIQRYIENHPAEFFFDGFRLGCRETGAIIKWNGTQWVPDGTLKYEWADTYFGDLGWQTFVETDPAALKPNGVPNVGNSGRWVSSDHVHPIDQTRLAKTVFDNTQIIVTSNFNNNSTDDFKVQFTDGGNKTMNVPYVRLAKSIHNWNGQSEFSDSTDSEDYYWAGTEAEYLAQINDIKNNTFLIVDDGEHIEPDGSATEYVSVTEMDHAGITIAEGGSLQRFVVTTPSEAAALINVPISLTLERNRYKIKNVISETAKDGQLVITDIKEGSNPTYSTYASTDDTQDTLLGIRANGQLYQTPQSDYVTVRNSLQNGFLTVAYNNGSKVQSLMSIDRTEGGIIVADGNGAIKSTSFTEAGKLLQTAGTNGELLAAEINVNTLVRSQPNEFTEMGIVVSTATGEIERQDLGEVEGQLLVTDGAHGLKSQTIDTESLVFIDNTGKVAAFPATTNDAGKTLVVQSNGKFGLQSPQIIPTHLPVTSVTASGTSGITLSFGETTTFEEGVLYLW